MNPYVNEDMMWQRLKDSQREAENRRLQGDTTAAALVALLRNLAARAWWIGGLATHRPPRRRPTWLVEDDRESASDAA